MLRIEEVSAPSTYRLDYRNGIEVAPVQGPLALGDLSTRLRIIDARFERGVYTLRVEGRRGRTYALRLTLPSARVTIEGAREVRTEGAIHELEVSMPEVPSGEGNAVSRRTDWATTTIVVTLGPATQ